MKGNEFSWFKLAHANGFGSKTIHYIYDTLYQGGLSMADLFEFNLKDLKDLLPAIGKGKFSRADFATLKKLNEDELLIRYNKLKSRKANLITLEDERYPKEVLENMQDYAPPILYCKGYLPLLNTPGVSIVGARDVDDFTILLTKSIASKLAENGFNVTSGYAKGVDTAAHAGAIEGGGTTTMILSFGLNHMSIKKEVKNMDLKKNTLFVSQFAPDDNFTAANAMRRNKLVSAMSKAIVVMAAGQEKDSRGKMSGTFDAAKGGLKMNIPVFVLSPEILKPTPKGNIELIKIGAIPFSNGNDIVNFLEIHQQKEKVSSGFTSKKKIQQALKQKQTSLKF